MTNHPIPANKIRAALTAAGWTDTPRWATPEERERCDLIVHDLTHSHEVHLLGGPGGSGGDRIVADLAAAGIPARRRGVWVVVN